VKLVDTHCHLDARQFEGEPTEAILARAVEAGVAWVVTIGTDEASSARAADLARAHAAVYATVGVDPSEAGGWVPDRLEAVRSLAASARVVAIGEIGLDYYWDKAPRDVQRRAFADQLDLAAELDLPVVIHSREAAADTEAMLLDWVAAAGRADGRPAGVMHCFSGTAEAAERLAGAGFMISFAGNVTYANAVELQRACAVVPGEALVLETDSPYLAPRAHRGQRNEPARIAEIAAFVAGVRAEPLADLAAATTRNATRLFGVDA
jgi:TatD DNase family protein